MSPKLAFSSVDSTGFAPWKRASPDSAVAVGETGIALWETKSARLNAVWLRREEGEDVLESGERDSGDTLWRRISRIPLGGRVVRPSLVASDERGFSLIALFGEGMQTWSASVLSVRGGALERCPVPLGEVLEGLSVATRADTIWIATNAIRADRSGVSTHVIRGIVRR